MVGNWCQDLVEIVICITTPFMAQGIVPRVDIKIYQPLASHGEKYCRDLATISHRTIESHGKEIQCLDLAAIATAPWSLIAREYSAWT